MAIALVETRANLGDADFPGGPVEQLNAEEILERFDMVGHARGRKVEALGCGRKAAAVDDLNEGAYADKPIHGNSCITIWCVS